jgi:hypothetical protein
MGGFGEYSCIRKLWARVPSLNLQTIVLELEIDSDDDVK